MQDLLTAVKLRDQIVREEVSGELQQMAEASEHHEVRSFLHELQDPATLGSADYRIGRRGPDFAARVRSVAGLAPRRLLEELRLRVFRRLLLVSPEAVGELAPLVGYSHDTLWRVFRERHAGLTPGRYRAEASGAVLGRDDRGFSVDDVLQGLAGELAPERGRALRDHVATLYRYRRTENAEATALQSLSDAEARRALAGRLDTRRGRSLVAALAERYPDPEGPPFTALELCRGLRCELPAARGRRLAGFLASLYPEPPIDEEPFTSMELESHDPAEVSQAAAFWEELRELPVEERRRRTEATAFRTPALFQLLRRKVREEGRRDRRLGVGIAELALVALQASRYLIPEPEYSNLLALGYAELGNARKFVLDFVGAEDASFHAEEAIRKVARDPQAAGVVLHLRAALRWYQRRFAEGIALEDQALPLLKRGGDNSLAAEALLMRGLLQQEAGSTDAAERDMRKAIDMAQLVDQDSQLLHSARFDLAVLLIEEGRAEEAECYVREYDRFLRDSGNRSDRFHTLVLFGRIEASRGSHRVAASYFEEAREVAEKTVGPLASAFASIELARAYLKLRSFSDVDRVLASSLPAFEALKIHREGIAAACLVAGALTEARYDATVLDEIRERLRLLQRDPAECAGLAVTS